MAKIARALTALEVARLDSPGYHAVGTVPGLYLQVTPSGNAKSWVLRVKVGMNRREIGLGPFPAVKLAQAHEKARQTREQIAAGIDPIEHKKTILSALIARQAQEMTFEAAARGYIDAHSEGWKHPKHAQQWENSLVNYAHPVIGKMNVRDIGLPHIMRVLEPIWFTKNETASRVRNRIELVLDWAKVRGHRTGDNPAAWRGNLAMMLPKPSKVQTVENQPAVMGRDAGAFMLDLRERQGIGARALEFVLLTASRSGEVRGATWAEIDLNTQTWTLPATRMKAGREHRVPLSGAALRLLEGLPRMAGTDLVFPSSQGGELSDATLGAVMRRMGFKDKSGRVAVPHGLRSTFRDWASERTAYPRELAEAALAHVIGNASEAAYARSDLFEKRRKLMADWAAFLDRVEVPADNVVALRGAA